MIQRLFSNGNAFPSKKKKKLGLILLLPETNIPNWYYVEREKKRGRCLLEESDLTGINCPSCTLMSDRAACMYIYVVLALSPLHCLFPLVASSSHARTSLACRKHLSLSPHMPEHDMVSPNWTVNFCVAVVQPFPYACVGFFLLKPRS